MRVLITGGAGFVGSHLAEKLVELDHEVFILDNLSNGSLDNIQNILDKVKFVNGDVSSRFFLNTFKNLDFDVIFHLACHPRSFSFKDPWTDVDVNIKGMINVLELAKKNKAKVIFSSNSGIYSVDKIPVDESCPDSPKTPYDVDKLAAEHYCKVYHSQFGIPIIIFRFATVYGPRQRINKQLQWKPVIIEFVSKMLRGIPPTIDGDGTQTRDFIYVKDIVNALVKSMNCDKAVGEVILLSTGIEISINRLFEMISDIIGVNLLPKYGPPKPGDIRRMCYLNRKARQILNWEPIYSLETGLKETVEWVKHNLEIN